MDLNAFLIIDQGGHGTRALVYNSLGDVITTSHAPVVTTNPKTGWFEQTAENLVASVHQCMQALSGQLLDQAIQIESAALITQRSSLVACHKDSLQAITPIISWQDTRNDKWLQQNINKGKFDISALKKLTGLRLNAHYGVSKMLWLLENNNEVQKASRENNLIFLPLASFITHLLTHSTLATVDAATASRTFLCEFGQQQWSETLLNLFSIQQDMLPIITPSKQDFGKLTLNNQSIPLRVVGGDQSFLPFAYGTETFNNSLFINAGTGAFVQTALSLAETPSHLLCSLATSDHQQQLTVAEGTVNACASALDWLFQQEQKTLTHDEIEHALRTILSPPVFYHRITALGSPYWLPAASSSFSESLTSKHQTLPEKTVAVIESIIFLLAINIDLLQQAKPQLRQIFISGGLSKSNGFCQKLANCTQLTMMRCADHEASSRGAAFYLANITKYPALKTASSFMPMMDDRSLLARYQNFYEWLRNEWMKNR